MSLPEGPWYIDDDFVFYQTAHDPATGGAVETADSPPTFRVYEKQTGTAIIVETMALLDSGNTKGLYSAGFPLLATTGFEVDKAYVVYREVVVGGVTDTAEESFKILTDPTTASDPWATALPGSYGAGTAGKMLSDLASGVTTLLSRIASALTITSGKVTPIDSADGIGFARWAKAVMAVAMGKATPADIGGGQSQVEYKDQSNNLAVTNTYDNTDGKRITSTIQP